MGKGVWLRVLLVIGLLGGCAALALNVEPRLGLDLRGGTQITLEAQSTERVDANAENTDKALEVIRGRVDSLGVSEPTLVRAGENRIIVELPDVQDPRKAIEVLGKTAQLTMHSVVGPSSEGAQPSKPENEVLPTDEGEYLEIGPTRISGEEVTGSDAVQPQNSPGWNVTIDFTGKGGDAWKKLTAEAACFQDDRRRAAIVLDGTIISSPPMASSVACEGGIGGGSTEITGNFTIEEANDLAVLIEGGALPLPVEIISQRTVGPTLGADAIEASWKAALIGLMLTGLFIILVYRVVGLLATLALTTYALISYALLVGLGATLTLPGLAGFVLAIGLAIDANVLVFERAREEYAAYRGGGLRRALMIGFNKAWTAIIDSNVTTLLAAALLFILASGPVKGFGVTLTIGVVASMISALIVARVLTEVAASRKWLNRRPGLSGLASIGRVRAWLDRKNPNLIARRALWLSISGVLLVLALIGIFGKGLNLGVEFTGGRVTEYSTSKPLSADDAREAVSEAGFPQAVVQNSDNDKIAVRTGRISEQEQIEIEDALADVGGDATKERDEVIGASLGDELRNKALIALGIALLAQMLYLAVRFKWTFGAAAVIAMFHDVIIVTGLFAWAGRTIDGVFLAAALTIVGLSVNDTVVVFDRIRERWRGSTDTSFMYEANRATIETMPRTINTGLGAMFILAALAVLGGDSLRDFSIALLLGLVIGTYSSVFTATPIATYLHPRWPMDREQRVKRDRVPEDSGAVI